MQESIEKTRARNFKKMIKIEINAEDTHAIVMDCSTGMGEVIAVKELNEFDDFGSELTRLELEDGREFESQDDCQTWKEV